MLLAYHNVPPMQPVLANVALNSQCYSTKFCAHPSPGNASTKAASSEVTCQQQLQDPTQCTIMHNDNHNTYICFAIISGSGMLSHVPPQRLVLSITCMVAQLELVDIRQHNLIMHVASRTMLICSPLSRQSQQRPKPKAASTTVTCKRQDPAQSMTFNVTMRLLCSPQSRQCQQRPKQEAASTRVTWQWHIC